MNKEMSSRIHGVDLARALAVIGMAYAHLAAFDIPGRQLPDGYASSLFAVLAGVSVSIMSNRGQPLLLRGVVILGIGTVLMSAQSGIIVVLTSIAWIIFLLGPVARWKIAKIVLLLVALILLGPALSASVLMGFYSDILNGPYPVLAWLAYGTAGILIHRLLLGAVWIQAALVAVGVVAVGLTYPYRYPLPVAKPVEHYSFISDYLSIYPHTGGIGDVVLSIIFSLAVISACLLVCAVPFAVAAVYPLRAVGSMALSFYVFHVLSAGWFLFGPVDLAGPAVSAPPAISAISSSAVAVASPETPPGDSLGSLEMGDEIPWPIYQRKVENSQSYEQFYKKESTWWVENYPDKEVGTGTPDYAGGSNSFFWGTVIVALIIAPLWKLKFRRGPLEELVAYIVRAGRKREVAAQ